MQSKKSSNSRLTLALLVVLLIGIVGFVGWRIWSAEQAKPVIEQESHQAPKDEKYLKLKELGIGINLKEEVKDVIYVAKTLSDGSPIAYISTESLIEKDNSCSADNGPLGAIMKTSKDTHEIFETKREVNGKTVFKLGEHFFILEFPNALCSDNEEAVALISKQRKAFAESFKTIELDSNL